VAKNTVLSDGEYLTLLTQSEWLFSSMVYLHYPLTFQSLTFLPHPPERITLLSGLKQQDKTSF